MGLTKQKALDGLTKYGVLTSDELAGFATAATGKPGCV